MRLAQSLLAGLTLALGGDAVAASKPAWMAVDKASETACKAASGFSNAVAGPPVRFSDRFLIDVRLVKGTYPQAHMKGAKGAMLCLYNRRTKRAEVQEAKMEPPMPATPVITDIMWKGVAINGRPPAEGSRISMMLDAGGRIGGRSSCNNFSARYILEENTLKVVPPVIGTRMACPPPLMEQEALFTDILEKAATTAVGADGALTISASDGRALTFIRE
jgi:heat shock protein HslJ